MLRPVVSVGIRLSCSCICSAPSRDGLITAASSALNILSVPSSVRSVSLNHLSLFTQKCILTRPTPFLPLNTQLPLSPAKHLPPFYLFAQGLPLSATHLNLHTALKKRGTTAQQEQCEYSSVFTHHYSYAGLCAGVTLHIV